MPHIFYCKRRLCAHCAADGHTAPLFKFEGGLEILIQLEVIIITFAIVGVIAYNIKFDKSLKKFNKKIEHLFEDVK